MKKNLLFITILILTISCTGQNILRIEDKLMDCAYQTYDDKGRAIKTLIFDFEQLLIDEKIIKDRNGDDYAAIFKKIALENDFDFTPSKSFLAELQKLAKPNPANSEECRNAILGNSSIEESKIAKLEIVLDSIQTSGNGNASKIANGILSVLSENDFELDYYKLRTLFLFDLLNPKSDIDLRIPELQTQGHSKNLDNALHIYVDEKNQIFVNGKLMNLKELREKIKNYESKNKSESIFTLKTELDTKYSKYIEVQNSIVSEILKLRDKLSLEKFKTSFEDLNTEETKEIKNIFPLTLIEE